MNGKARPLRSGLFLFVVVGFAFENGVGPVDLFRCEGADHLMRKRHGAQAHERLGFLTDARGEAIGTADDEHYVAQAAVLQALQVLRKGQLTHGFSLFIQQDEVVHTVDESIENDRLRFLHRGRIFLRLLQLGIRGFDELKFAVVPHAVDVDFCPFSDPIGLRFTDGQ